MDNYYNSINTAILIFGLISGCLFVISEILGTMNKYSSSCTSITEFILKTMHIIREPSLEERLDYLQNQRLNRSSLSNTINMV